MDQITIAFFSSFSLLCCFFCQIVGSRYVGSYATSVRYSQSTNSERRIFFIHEAASLEGMGVLFSIVQEVEPTT